MSTKHSIYGGDDRYVTEPNDVSGNTRTTCARRNASEMMRENTDSEVFFQKYTLSEETMTRLESIREAMKDNIAQANPLWKVIAGQNEEETHSETEESNDDDDVPMNNSETQNTQMRDDQSALPPSTQFYFTQVETIVEPRRSTAAVPQRCDILECACENLERNNGRLDLTQLDNLPDEDLVPLVNEMARKLSHKGIYNLCQSLNDMTVEQRMRYLNVFCTHLLLPKILELEEPSRLLSSAIVECIKIFPDEVQQLIFVPILSTELKDVTLMTTIVNTFDQDRKIILLGEFLEYVKELKLWHISVLQNFLSVRLDHNMIDKITKLFSEKALCYSKDKNFGKLVLSFLKVITALSEEQKSVMTEIAAVNETLFKKPMENILKKM
ncbi:PREDICTED: uncharacterized protein LOC105450729 [Wasmannia auropunctata]|uniref:uncharacterized protein LOC105450729 n=1 Tax=Wasmannia auropunctata TaxID=64793 RepID=UPI0005EF136A|nr:PREDICTED: uncharacterized protein LOC105450729 [Wasmannia auropunctata]